MELTVILPAHNPHRERLLETLAGLRAQSLSPDRWETLVIDNASREFTAETALQKIGPPNLRLLQEPELGLAFARATGFRAARGDCVVMVDDDNILAPNYLERVLKIFDELPQLGLAGGKSVPRFEREPALWTQEFYPLLALRDLGNKRLLSRGLRDPRMGRNVYPAFAPLGAGMALRRAAWNTWLRKIVRAGVGLSDRRGSELSSGGDNDIVLCAMAEGWEAGYFPELTLTHLIPAGRLDASYLTRLNHDIQKSWMQVLTLHNANPWAAISPLSARLRKTKAWWSHRPWTSPAARVRWQGACGHFDGRVSIEQATAKA